MPFFFKVCLNQCTNIWVIVSREDQEFILGFNSSIYVKEHLEFCLWWMVQYFPGAQEKELEYEKVNFMFKYFRCFSNKNIAIFVASFHKSCCKVMHFRPRQS